MSDLDELYQQNKGESIPSFDGDSANDGQCEQWALMVRTKRDGLPVRYGNAIDWWTNRGTDVNWYEYISYAPGVYTKAGDYVVWGAGVGSKAGHIDLCAKDGDANGFLGYDSNWGDIPKLTIVQHNYAFGILGYVRLKGVIMNNGDVDNLYQSGWQRPATADELKTWVGKSMQEFFYNGGKNQYEYLWEQIRARDAQLAAKPTTVDPDGQKWRDFKTLIGG